MNSFQDNSSDLTQRSKKRCRTPHDSFFEEGNIVCRLAQEQYLLKRNDLDNIAGDGEEMEEDFETYPCQINGCRHIAASISSFEQHYATIHRNVCTTCHKILPTNYLLEIHIDENHSPMFESLAATQPQYKCLVVGCSGMFQNTKKRHKHLVEQHKYPSSFRFERSNKQKSQMKKISPESMDTSLGTNDGANSSANPQATSRFKYSYKVPDFISFGHGNQKTFVRNGKKARNHLSKINSATKTLVNKEPLDLQDMSDALNS